MPWLWIGIGLAVAGIVVAGVLLVKRLGLADTFAQQRSFYAVARGALDNIADTAALPEGAPDVSPDVRPAQQAMAPPGIAMTCAIEHTSEGYYVYHVWLQAAHPAVSQKKLIDCGLMLLVFMIDLAGGGKDDSPKFDIEAQGPGVHHLLFALTDAQQVRLAERLGPAAAALEGRRRR